MPRGLACTCMFHRGLACHAHAQGPVPVAPRERQLPEEDTRVWVGFCWHESLRCGVTPFVDRGLRPNLGVAKAQGSGWSPPYLPPLPFSGWSYLTGPLLLRDPGGSC